MTGMPVPGMAKTMSSMLSAGLAARLASMIAWRNEPAPASFVFVTVNVANRSRDSTLSKCVVGRAGARRRVARGRDVRMGSCIISNLLKRPAELIPERGWKSR
jgi:hypothetical protein